MTCRRRLRPATTTIHRATLICTGRAYDVEIKCIFSCAIRATTVRNYSVAHASCWHHRSSGATALLGHSITGRSIFFTNASNRFYISFWNINCFCNIEILTEYNVLPISIISSILSFDVDFASLALIRVGFSFILPKVTNFSALFSPFFVMLLLLFK